MKKKKEIRDHFTTYQKQAKWALSKKHYGTKKKKGEKSDKRMEEIVLLRQLL